MTTFLLNRGKGALRRVAHIARHDAFGQIAGSWCGRPYNMSSNVPWGQPPCKDCIRKANKAAAQ